MWSTARRSTKLPFVVGIETLARYIIRDNRISGTMAGPSNIKLTMYEYADDAALNLKTQEEVNALVEILIYYIVRLKVLKSIGEIISATHRTHHTCDNS